MGEQTDRIVLYYSEDDVSVPPLHGEQYKHDLPHAEMRLFKDRGHFLAETFPELVADIRAL
jgi:pimeloyl-ACP methyl ester carboxylesterase